MTYRTKRERAPIDYIGLPKPNSISEALVWCEGCRNLNRPTCNILGLIDPTTIITCKERGYADRIELEADSIRKVPHRPPCP